MMMKPLLPRLSIIALLAFAYFAAGRFGLSLAFLNISASAVWPPTGIALAALLVFGYRVWPGVLLGAFLVNLTTSDSLPASLMIAAGNTLEAVLGAYLVNRFAGGRRAFDKTQDIFRFVVLGALAAMVSATVGVTALGVTGLANWADYGPIWLTWWLGDATGALIVAPALVLWADRERRWNPKRAVPTAWLLATVIGVGAVMFGGLLPAEMRHYPLTFLVLPVVAWAGFHFGRRETATVTLILSGLAIWGTLHGIGPFAIYTANEALLLLQSFMGVVAITGLVLATVVEGHRRAQAALRENEQQYRIVTQTATDAIIVVDEANRITFINAGAEKIFGYPVADMMGRELTLLIPGYLRPLYSTAFDSAAGVELTGRHRDGRDIPLEASFGEFHQDHQHLFIGIVRDITERKRADESQRWLATIVETSSDAIIGKTLQGVVLSWNQAAERMYGYTAHEMVGNSLMLLVPPERAEEIPQLLERLARGERIENYETQRVCKDGRVLNVSLTISPIRDADGTIRGASTIARDVTERKKVEGRIRYLAQHDALTGLPNRILFRDRIGQAIAHARRQQQQVAVLFLDLDGFKHINDSLGHQVGDHLLRMTARRLQACVREGDSVARLGGDEFIISLPGLSDGRDAMPIASKILEALREPYPIEPHELYLSGSIGISVYPGDGQDAETLMRAADTAMYHAKDNGRNNYAFFTARLNETARRRLNIANMLHHALEHDEFALHYQPQVDLESGHIIAAEALIRWWRPDFGPISPTEFIKVAEETGLIVPIGEWVLRQACQRLRRWRDGGHPDMRITVNLSPQQFRRPGFADITARVLRESGIPPSALDLEITESVLLVQSEENLALLEQLAGMGIHMAVDDFGVGYSSLAYLQRFPIHTLKIDRSFVNGIGRDPNDTALVSAIIAMAHSLNLSVIAEGVENADQAAFLKSHGCKAAQGFYFGAAVSAESFTELLRTDPATAAVSQFSGY